MRRYILLIFLAVVFLIGYAIGVATRDRADAPDQPVLQPVAADVQSRTTAVDYGSGLYAGTTSAVVREGDPATASVLVVGDSITVRCRADLRTALAAKGKTLAVLGQSGQNTAGLLDLLSEYTDLPPVTVMASGANDVFNPPAMAGQVSRAKTMLAGRTTMLWVDTYVGRTYKTAAVQMHDVRNSGWVNGQIYAGVPAGQVLGWNVALGAAVGRGKALSLYLQDGVHPWAEAADGHGDGCAFWAATIAGPVSKR